MSEVWREVTRMLGICLAGAAAFLLAVQPTLAMPSAQTGGRPINPPPWQAALAAPADVQASHRTLADLLALVPDTEASRAWLSYGDVAAWHEATGVPRVVSFDALLELTNADREAWLHTLSEQTGPPAALGIQYLAAEEMRPVYSFDFFDVAQMLEVGRPPESLTYVSLNVAPPTIDAALEADGYAVETQDAATLYSRGGDYAVDLAAETHVAQLGLLNRIALLDSDEPGSQLLIARATAPITQSLEANAGEARSLYDDRTYRTLVNALERGSVLTGALVGLIVQDGMQPVDVQAFLNSEGEAIMAQMDRYARDPLPPYRLSAFATSRDGDDTWLTVLIAMDSNNDASESAAILGDRLGDYVSAVNGESLGDQWDVEVTGAFESDARIAYVVLKLRPDSRLSWMELIARRDLLFLATE